MVQDMFPMRVLIETVRPQHCLSCAHDGTRLLDTYAIVSAQTMLSDIVEVVLSALGLPHMVSDSRGLVQINNWKPLAFEVISDHPEDEPVGALFKDLAPAITLKILTKGSSNDPSNGHCLTDLKQRLLKVAIERHPQFLTTVDNQQIRDIIQQVIRGDEFEGTISHEHLSAINEWLDQIACNEEKPRRSVVHQTRFSQAFEVPRLERWFRSTPNPSRKKLEDWMKILNSLPFRRTQNKITYQQICNWFTQKRNIQRHIDSLSEEQNTKGQPLATLPTMVRDNKIRQQRNHSSTADANQATSFFEAMDLSSNNHQSNSGKMGTNGFQQKLHSLFNGLLPQMAAVCPQGNDAPTDAIIPMANFAPDIRSKFIPSGAVAGAGISNNTKSESTRSSSCSRHGAHGSHHSGEQIDGGSDTPESASNAGAEDQPFEEPMCFHHKDEMLLTAATAADDQDSIMEVTPSAESSPVGATTTSNNSLSTRHHSRKGQARRFSANGQGENGPNGAIVEPDDGTSQQPSSTTPDGQGTANQESSSFASNLKNCTSSSGVMGSFVDQLLMSTSAAGGKGSTASMGGIIAGADDQQPTNQSNSFTNATIMNMLMQQAAHQQQQQQQIQSAEAAAANQAAMAFAAQTLQSQMMMAMTNAALGARISASQTPPRAIASPMGLFSTAGGGGLPSSTTTVATNGLLKSPSTTMLFGGASGGLDNGILKMDPGASSGLSNSQPSTPHPFGGNGNQQQNNGAANGQQGQARSRLMFDPLSELPVLERWFEENPHPGWLQIEQFTETLNSYQYRQSYPPVSTHNVKIWFKNRRAKCKRLLTGSELTNGIATTMSSISK